MTHYKAKSSRYRLVPKLYSFVNPKLEDVDVKQGDCFCVCSPNFSFRELSDFVVHFQRFQK